jgi:hypothetical protein
MRSGGAGGEDSSRASKIYMVQATRLYNLLCRTCVKSVPALSYGDAPPNHCQSQRPDDPLPTCYYVCCATTCAAGSGAGVGGEGTRAGGGGRGGDGCENKTFVEFGAGKGMLSLAVAQTSDSTPIDVHPTPTSLQFRVLYTYVRMHLYILGA